MAIIDKVRVVKNNYGSWELHYKNPDGRRRRPSVGPDQQIAQRLAFKFTDWLLDGKDPEAELKHAEVSEKIGSLTLREFYPEFISRHGKLQSHSMQEIFRYRFKHILRAPQICEISMKNLSRAAVYKYMDLRREEDSASTVNSEARIIRCMLNKAVDWEHLNYNLVHRLKLFPEPPKRNVRLTPEQAAILIDRLPDKTADIVEFAIYSGFRKSNIYDMKIEQIQFNTANQTAEIELEIKGGRFEVFPVCPHAVSILRANIGNRKIGYVFLNPKTGKPFKDIHRAFNTAVKELGLMVNGTKLRIHDLRHIVPTWLHQQGIGDDILQQLLGHRDRETTDRYITRNRAAVAGVLSLVPQIRKRPEDPGKLTLLTG